MSTASERAAEINACDPDDGFKLVEDVTHPEEERPGPHSPFASLRRKP